MLANRALPLGYTERPVVRLPYPTRGSDAARLAAVALGMARPARLPDGLDLVHYPLTVPVPRTRLPGVVTLHDLQHLELPEYFSRAELAYRRVAYQRAARTADIVVTPSAHARDMAAERIGVDPQRVVVAPHGVDHERFRPDAPGELAIDVPDRFLYYPANLWPHKNHSRLLEALARVPDVELVLCGNPYDRLPALLDEARRLGVHERVLHLGFVAHDVVPALLRRARAMVFPSLFEGFGQPPLEAMACGCPVACSDIASLPEVVGDAARLFDPHDAAAIAAAVEDVLAAPAEWSRRGLERAGAFSWDETARAHERVYRELLRV